MKKNTYNKNNTLEILNLLMNNFISKEEICSYLNIKLPTFYKCLKTIKNAGFEVEKKGIKYSSSKFSKSINFTSLETSIFSYLLFLSYSMLPDKKNKYFYNAIMKILHISTKENYEETILKFESHKKTANDNIFKEKVELLQKYKDNKYVLKIVLHSGKKYILTPLDFHWQNGKAYFYFINQTKRKKMILIDKIEKIIPEDKIEYIPEAKETIFELYGRLAKIYVLKENERIIDSFPDKLVIANGSSDKEVLFRRLLRYDELCKVLFPKEDVKTFKEIIEKSLDNIS